MRRLYPNKYFETLFLFSFTCLLNHNDEVSRRLEYLLARAVILNNVMDNVNSNVTSNVTGNVTGNFTDNAVPASVKRYAPYNISQNILSPK